MGYNRLCLGEFTEDEKKTIYNTLVKAAEAAVTIVTSGIDEAMNMFNGDGV